MQEGKRKTWLGIGSWTFPYHCGLGNKISAELAVQELMTPFELIEKAAELGVCCVQICENRPLDIYTDQQLEEIRTFAVKRGIQLEVGMRGATRENLVKMLAITRKLGAKLLRCVIDLENYEPEMEEIVTNLKSVLPILKESNIVLGIENHDRFTASQFAALIKQLHDKHYGIVLDTTNSLAQEEPVEKVLDELAKYTVCLHFKDYTIVRGPGTVGLEIIGTAVGAGRQQVATILERIQVEAQQDFSTIVEFWMPSEDNLERTLDKELVWAEQSIRYLQEIVDGNKMCYDKKNNR